ncbi:hypothetical protein BDV93DRAFT_558031 [Ceratobasidium sp. AG-I]|nr:hypothetical protein BDV93DRAFT_558031 [Ceratobasidium sp. AG-I]
MRMAGKDSYGSEGESELGPQACTYIPLINMILISVSYSVVSCRREEIRRQCIESEQRRCNDLCKGFARLKDILPASNQKGSKMALLDRAVVLWSLLHLPASTTANVSIATHSRCGPSVIPPHTHDKRPSLRPRGRQITQEEFCWPIIAYAEQNLLQFGPIQSFKTKSLGNGTRPS